MKLWDMSDPEEFAEHEHLFNHDKFAEFDAPAEEIIQVLDDALAASGWSKPGEVQEAFAKSRRIRGLQRGIARGEKIREEIEARRPRIRRAADLAEKLVAYAGGETIPPAPSRTLRTVNGIALRRARRIQLRERSELPR